MDAPKPIEPLHQVENLIYLIRGQKVMLDADLARLYEVETKALNRAVKRNAGRFPPDFAFRLTGRESESLKCQIGTSKKGRGGRRNFPLVFTEQGVAMLSGVLTSECAVRVNVAIMRAFVRLRRMISGNKHLAEKLRELENRIGRNDEAIDSLFDAIRKLMTMPDKPRSRIGFKPTLE